MNDTGDKKERGTYQCASCSSVLFSASDKMETKSGTTTFEKPVDIARLQFKKEPDARGEREMRCAECKSNIGHVLSNGTYRVYPASLSFKPVGRIEILEEPEDRIIEKRHGELKMTPGIAGSREGTASQGSAMPQGRLAQLLGAGVFGVVIGAAGALLILQSAYAPQDLSFTALPAATSTEETSAPTDASETQSSTPSPETDTDAIVPSDEPVVPPIEVSTSSGAAR